jgi:hypothetical protein
LPAREWISRGQEGLWEPRQRAIGPWEGLGPASGPSGLPGATQAIGGTGSKGRAEEIGKGRLKVTVPAKLWKVILVLPREDAKPRKNTSVLSIIVTNDQSVDPLSISM